MLQRAIPAVTAVRLVSRRQALAQLCATSLLASCAYRRIPGYQYTPALYSVTLPKGIASYLFGSVHVGLERFYPLPKTVEACLDKCKSLAVEVDTETRFAEATELFRPHVRLPTGTNLSDVIGSEKFNALARHFEWFADDIERYQRFAPWYVTLFMTSADDDRIGVERQVGIETKLISLARDKGLPIIELETIADQVNAIVSGDLIEQTEHLLMRFEQVRQWDKSTLDLIDAWRLGDTKALNRVKSRNFGDSITLPKLRKRIFADRDSVMADNLIKHLQGISEPCFAVVGAFHLVGDDQLQTVLQAKGVEVKRIYY
jgi:uncharacterized protein